LKAIKAKEYHDIWYIMPDAARRDQVERAFYKIGKITTTISGRKEMLKLDPKIHLSYFKFMTIAEVEHYLQSHPLRP
jgi:hypothetical protein